MSKRSEWTWKTSDPAVNARLHLKYEPGNWGDVLKGAWLVPVAREIAQQRQHRSCAAPLGQHVSKVTCPDSSPGSYLSPPTPVPPALDGGIVRYLDPFAGAPSYPLLKASATRLELLPAGEHLERLRFYTIKGEWPSCALLARDTLRAHGAVPKLLLFDAHAQARSSWSHTEDAEVIECASGEYLFEKRRRKLLAPDLVLLDSYDFFDRWGGLLSALESIAREVPVLVYVFNTSPKGQGHASQYLRLRKKLTAAAKANGPILLGRLPYDMHCPQAYHEVLLLAPRIFTSALRAELKANSEELARRHAGASAFEVIQ